MSLSQKYKIFYLLLYVFISCGVVLLIRPPYILSIGIVLLLPSLVNFLWLHHARARVFIFSLVSAVIFAPPVELAARLANAWDVQSVFPRMFGLVPLENMLFAFLNFLWALSFYEYFIDKDHIQQSVSKYFKFLIGLYVIFAGVIFSLYFYDPTTISLQYMVLAVIILFIPAVLIFWHKPLLIKKTLIPTLFFALVFFVYEIVSLLVGSWWWPGEYVFPITLLGHIFPIDDIIIWYFVSTPVLIGGYEFFIDDDK